MKIKLTCDLPIDPNCGCVEGKEYEAEFKCINDEGDVYQQRGNPVIFVAENGEKVSAFSYEYEIISRD